jgi:hypothetical protein
LPREFHQQEAAYPMDGTFCIHANSTWNLNKNTNNANKNTRGLQSGDFSPHRAFPHNHPIDIARSAIPHPDSRQNGLSLHVSVHTT